MTYVRCLRKSGMSFRVFVWLWRRFDRMAVFTPVFWLRSITGSLWSFPRFHSPFSYRSPIESVSLNSSTFGEVRTRPIFQLWGRGKGRHLLEFKFSNESLTISSFAFPSSNNNPDCFRINIRSVQTMWWLRRLEELHLPQWSPQLQLAFKVGFGQHRVTGEMCDYSGNWKAHVTIWGQYHLEKPIPPASRIRCS